MHRKRLRQKWDQLNREDLLSGQGVLLHRYLRDYVIPFSAFYQALFKQEGLVPEDIRSIQDLQKIPFTSKKDLLDAQEDPDRNRDFVLIPDESVLKKTTWYGLPCRSTRAATCQSGVRERIPPLNTDQHNGAFCRAYSVSLYKT
ncbi:MAG: hypothetical protein GKR87_16495 [Kiritimatiellae bacterium]|nr:hypothetical protein [Kiritimatiellia bacterium]